MGKTKLPLTIFCFLYSQPKRWKDASYAPYNYHHVNATYRAVQDRIRVPHRFICVTDQPEGIECETMPIWEHIWINGTESCYLRLRLFSSEFQKRIGTEFLMNIDLDSVIMQDATTLIEWAMTQEFVIMEGSRYGRFHGGGKVSHYNGSIWVVKSGARPFFWDSLSDPDRDRKRAEFRMPDSGIHIMGSDQAWISMCSDKELTFQKEHGVIQFRDFYKRGFPDHVTMMFFAGKIKPWHGWVQDNYPDIYREWARYGLP